MKHRVKNICVYGLLIGLVLLIDLPILNMIGVSFKGSREIMMNNDLFPRKPTLENYIGVFEKSNILQYLKNSFFVAVVVTVLTSIVAALAGYAISRYQRKYRVLGMYSRVLLVMQMFPTILMLIPLFIIFIITDFL